MSARLLAVAVLLLVGTGRHASAQEWVDLRIYDEDFRPVLDSAPYLAQFTGATLVEHEGELFLLAVGFTGVKPIKSSVEIVLQKKVSQKSALKALAELQEGVDVQGESMLHTLLVKAYDGDSGRAQKDMEEKNFTSTMREQVKALVLAPHLVATWKSADGFIFYTALGTKLNK